MSNSEWKVGGGYEPIPVTVLCGYLGSGKTTVLNHILKQRGGMRVAVIVNDMSEVNIDAKLIKSGSALSRTEEKLIELSNGCICCTLRDDLLQEVRRLTEEGRFDAIVIESTGVGEPIPIAQTFTYMDDNLKIDLSEQCRLDTMVTVVDAYRFWHDFSSGDSLLERQQAVGHEDERDVVDLLIDQIEFCDVLLLNKCDMVQTEELDQLEQLMRKLQPRARIIRTVKGQVDVNDILNTHLFNFEAASISPGWMQELQREEHTPETEEYGIGSMVFRSRRPFHPERLGLLFEEWPEAIIRAKGTLWIASRNDIAASISQAGASIRFGPAGYWIAALPDDERQIYLDAEPDLAANWEPRWGDRMTELVCIGIDLDREVMNKRLEDCVLRVDEVELDWSSFPDPLPSWDQALEQVEMQEIGTDVSR
ncbi:GTP-binding protein [Paenibacillus sp. ACRRX]|uniref:GTP-binding protein n=1 Tax=Paenibacillus sp. ACRRX TaxID=2918206 RepID=UPI001EF6C262|nr:GTP-binding protein [Paenibacillus sp. ACRRX]MCG7406186.1 GTP-binding protein [Paenibacillus sp. ACRRX]